MDSWAQDLLPGRDEQLTSVTVDITALLHCIKVVSTISSHHSEHVHFITLLKLQRWQPWAGVYTKQSGKNQNAKRLVWLHFGLKATAVIISEQNKPIYRANSWSIFATGGKRFWSQCIFTAWLGTCLTGLQTTSTCLFLTKKIELHTQLLYVYNLSTSLHQSTSLLAHLRQISRIMIKIQS